MQENNQNEANTQHFKAERFQQDLLEWFQHEKRELPWRQDKDPYKIWVSEIMLQQTRVDTVIPYFNRFIGKFPTVQDLAAADEQTVLKEWEGLGYYSRVRHLHSATKDIVVQYQGQIPEQKAELAKLKGVGPYTLGAILSIAFDQAEPAVDGNVMRVCSRIFALHDDIGKQATRKKIEVIVRDMIAKDNPADFNQALMELGALICTPKSPSCLLCPVQSHCQAFAKGEQTELPIKEKKKRPKDVQLLTIVLINHENKVLVQKRKDRGLLANLWEFPSIENTGGFLTAEEQLQQFVKQNYQISAQIETKVQELKHVFTHIVWHMSVWLGKCDHQPKGDESFRFVTLTEMKQLPFPVPHQKIIATLTERGEKS